MGSGRATGNAYVKRDPDEELIVCPPDCEGCEWDRAMAEDMCLHGKFEDCADCDDATPNLRPGHREPLGNGDEYDAFTGWRKLIRWGRGTIAKIKRQHAKRTRRAGKPRAGL